MGPMTCHLTKLYMTYSFRLVDNKDMTKKI